MAALLSLRRPHLPAPARHRLEHCAQRFTNQIRLEGRLARSSGDWRRALFIAAESDDLTELRTRLEDIL